MKYYISVKKRTVHSGQCQVGMVVLVGQCLLTWKPPPVTRPVQPRPALPCYDLVTTPVDQWTPVSLVDSVSSVNTSTDTLLISNNKCNYHLVIRLWCCVTLVESEGVRLFWLWNESMHKWCWLYVVIKSIEIRFQHRFIVFFFQLAIGASLNESIAV